MLSMLMLSNAKHDATGSKPLDSFIIRGFPKVAMTVEINFQGRSLSLPKNVVKRGVADWNSQAWQ